MEKKNYTLADELMSAEEARTKTYANREGHLINLRKMNQRIKDAVDNGKTHIEVIGLPEFVISILKERGFTVAVAHSTGSSVGVARATLYTVSWD